MEIQPISNAVLKRFSQIGDRKFHGRHGEFLVEGVRIVEEAMEAGRVRELALAPAAENNGRIAALVADCEERGIRVYRCDAGQMERITRTVNNQGIAAGAALPDKSTGEIYGELLQVPSGTILLLDGVQDPGNVGTLLRTAEAFSAAGAILAQGCAGLYNPKTIRATMGSLFRLRIAEIRSRKSVDILREFSSRGFQTVVTDLSPGAVPLPKARFAKKNLIAIGSEAAGVSRGLSEAADLSVYIPMSGPTESLNAAVAGGMVLYRALADSGSSG